MMSAETVNAGDAVFIGEFTIAERRLLLLFYSGFVVDTIDTLRQALSDTYDRYERSTVAGLIVKLDGMSDAALTDFILESEGFYA